MDPSATSHGWCSLRLRFDGRELGLLSSAEQLRGAVLAQTPRPDVLRTALSLAKAGHKLRTAAPGSSVNLDEAEVALLSEALRFAAEEIRNGHEAARRDAVMSAFPELAQKGSWRAFGLAREIEAITQRLETAIRG
jgi:hypothetical protein